MPLSRLELAAALLEYVNDNSDSTSPRRSHRDSAIFAPIQAAQAAERRRQILSQPPPFLPSPLALDTPSSHGPSVPAQRQSEAREEVTEDLADVDVARWGLPDHLVSTPTTPTSLASPSGVTRPRPPAARRVTVSQPVPEAVQLQSRVKSIHVSDLLEDADSSPLDWRQGGRGSMSPEDATGAQRALAEAERVRRLAEGRPQTVMGLQLDDVVDRGGRDPIMVPLPLSPSPRARSRPLSSLSRALTPGLCDEAEYLDEHEQKPPSEPNPFALPAPPPELGSRFDPKSLEAQRRSSIDSTLGARPQSRVLAHADRPSSRMSLGLGLHAPAGLSAQMQGPSFDDLPTARPTVIYDEIPTAEQYGRPLMPKRYSTSMMRDRQRQSLLPKVLVMPAPLSGTETIRSPPRLPEGFTIGEKPLPAEARTAGARPGLPLSLSQRTFRSSLIVDGQRDEYFPGEADEGEVAISRRERDEDALERKPGKLFGRSLMDELESRKAAMKGKQRQFQGDSRPRMMARTSQYSMYDNLDLIPTSPASPSSFNGPNSPHSPYSPDPPHSLNPHPRPTSSHPDARPLLHMSSSGNIQTTATAQEDDRLSKSRSVFGVDTLWEREMAKLKLMQEDERVNSERAAAASQEAGRKKNAKGRAKGKGKAKMGSPLTQVTALADLEGEEGAEQSHVTPVNRTSDLPPVLQYSPEKARVPIARDGGESQTVDKGRNRRRENRDGYGLGGGEWFESSDEEEPNQTAERNKAEGKKEAESGSDDDDEDNQPLSRIAPSASAHSTLRAFHTHKHQRPSILPPASSSGRPGGNLGSVSDSDSDSDEDVPLSKLAQVQVQSSNSKSQAIASTLRALGATSIAQGRLDGDKEQEEEEEEEEDDLPLAVRQAKAKGLEPPSKAEIIEDDLPLGYKYADVAQRRVYQQQQQQQQMQYPAYPIGQQWDPHIPYAPAGSGPMFNPYMPMSVPYAQSFFPHPNPSPYPYHLTPYPPYPPLAPYSGVIPSSAPGPDPGPGHNIDTWRKEVVPRSASAATSAAPSVRTETGSGSSH